MRRSWSATNVARSTEPISRSPGGVQKPKSSCFFAVTRAFSAFRGLVAGPDLQDEVVAGADGDTDVPGEGRVEGRITRVDEQRPALERRDLVARGNDPDPVPANAADHG